MRATLAAREPMIRTDGVNGAVVYTEYLTDDARLTIANVRDAAAHGAVVANYAAVTELVQGGRRQRRSSPTRCPRGARSTCARVRS